MSYAQYTAFVSAFATPVSAWLKSQHSIEVSADEIAKIMSGGELSAVQNITSSLPSLPVPPKLTESSKPASKPKSTKPTAKPEAEETVSSSSTSSGCQHKFTRGDNKGETCGKACATGSKFCTRHKKGTDELEPVAKPVEPKQSSKSKAPATEVGLTPASSDDKEDYTLQRIAGTDLLRIKGHNLVVKVVGVSEDDKHCEFVGAFDDDPSILRDPTVDELATLRKFDIDVPAPKTTKPAPKATKPTLTANIAPNIDELMADVPPKPKVTNALKASSAPLPSFSGVEIPSLLDFDD